MVFAGYPTRAVLVDLFLPDRDHLFDTVHGFVAGEEGVFAVRRANGDDQANLPDADCPDAMTDCYLFQTEFADQLLTHFFQFLNGHLVEGFVLKSQDRLALKIVPGGPQKSYDGAVCIAANLGRDFLGVEGITGQFYHRVISRWSFLYRCTELPAAHGWNQANIVARSEDHVCVGVIRVHRNHDLYLGRR